MPASCWQRLGESRPKLHLAEAPARSAAAETQVVSNPVQAGLESLEGDSLPSFKVLGSPIGAERSTASCGGAPPSSGPSLGCGKAPSSQPCKLPATHSLRY